MPVVTMDDAIMLTKAEIQSRHDRVKWAEGLILQLPKDHDGRNSWLLNYGQSEEAKAKQAKRGLVWNDHYRAAGVDEQGGTP